MTGSTSGIGLGIATALAAEGVDVVLNGFGDPAEIERQRAALADAHGVRAAYVASDMAKPAEIRDLVAEAERRFGRVDILVNNAGIQHVAKIVDFPEERWDQVIAINLSAAFHTTKAALPGMIARGWGRIINIASAHGLVASGEKAAYVDRQARPRRADQGDRDRDRQPGGHLQRDLSGLGADPAGRAADRGARPGGQASAVEQASDDMLREKQPMLAFTTPEKIAALTVFLCGEAASTITGAALSIDGGWIAQ